MNDLVVRSLGLQPYREVWEAMQSFTAQRDKTTVSLLESQRRTERERIETWQRERENRYRVAKGLPPLKKGDEIPEGKDSVIPDAALEESARIVGDLIALGGAGGTLVMTR